jgi:magnesium transporter
VACPGGLDRLLKEEDSPLGKKIRGYMRDCLDHQLQINDSIEVLRENVMGLQELFFSLQGHRLNDVMKVLTIIATIFIPLGFIAGLYGMNFDRDSSWNMPELGWRFGYFFALGIMLVVVVIFLVYFRYKGWLGGAGGKDEGDDGEPI